MWRGLADFWGTGPSSGVGPYAGTSEPGRPPNFIKIAHYALCKKEGVF